MIYRRFQYLKTPGLLFQLATLVHCVNALSQTTSQTTTTTPPPCPPPVNAIATGHNDAGMGKNTNNVSRKEWISSLVSAASFSMLFYAVHRYLYVCFHCLIGCIFCTVFLWWVYIMYLVILLFIMSPFKDPFLIWSPFVPIFSIVNFYSILSPLFSIIFLQMP